MKVSSGTPTQGLQDLHQGHEREELKIFFLKSVASVECSRVLLFLSLDTYRMQQFYCVTNLSLNAPTTVWLKRHLSLMLLRSVPQAMGQNDPQPSKTP